MPSIFRYLLERAGRSTILFVFLLALVPVLTTAAADESDVQQGRQLYWTGVTASGKPTTAATGNGIVLSGSQVSCVNCHRPSGFGSSEGGKYVPPITGPILFAPRQLDRNRTFYKFFKEAQPSQFSARLREPRMRPAYTSETLATALRDGVDPANHKLDAEMPRYQLADSDMANLTAYLKTLSVTPDPGVDKNTIHIATVVTDGTDPGQRAAVLNTISTFFDWMNTRVTGQRSHPNFSPNYHSDFQVSFQKWELHVWELHGPPETWNEQIRLQYQKQPVFAVVSGLVQGPWSPIAKFCDVERVPCIFPNTELPRTENADYKYSLYFSRGLELEAEVMAHFVAGEIPRDALILQIHSGDAYGLTPADAFVRASKRVMPQARIESIEIASAEELRRAIRASTGGVRKPVALIVWPGQYLNNAVADLGTLRPDIKIVTLPADTLEISDPATLQALPKNVLITYPYALPTSYYPRVFRVRQWMNSRKLAITYPRLQFQTYYALTLLQFGLDQILDDYYRDYLIEAIEHEAESHLDNGTHPTLALGPGQRFASKGAYVLKIDPVSQGGVRAISEWIVP